MAYKHWFRFLDANLSGSRYAALSKKASRIEDLEDDIDILQAAQATLDNELGVEVRETGVSEEAIEEAIREMNEHTERMNRE